MKNDQGQATVEYILLLTVTMGFLVIVTTRLVTPAFRILSTELNSQIEKKVFGSDMHYFPIRR